MSIWRAFIKPSFIIIILLGMICMLAPPVVSAENESGRINRVKAAFVLNVARFVTWPDDVFDSSKNRLVLCYYRSKPFADGLDSISGKTVAGRQLEIVRVEHLSAAKSCQMLLISAPQLNNFAKEVQPGRSQALLTITDMTHASPVAGDAAVMPKGVLLSLVRKGSHIGFEIDLSKCRSVGLKMSSEFLKHARIVGGGPES